MFRTAQQIIINLHIGLKMVLSFLNQNGSILFCFAFFPHKNLLEMFFLQVLVHRSWLWYIYWWHGIYMETEYLWSTKSYYKTLKYTQVQRNLDGELKGSSQSPLTTNDNLADVLCILEWGVYFNLTNHKCTWPTLW